MIAARIVHRSKHARRWASGGGSRKWRVGSPPPIPPPLMPPAGAEESGRARLRQGGVSYEGRVVAVDLLSMEALPGVEVSVKSPPLPRSVDRRERKRPFYADAC